MVLSTFAYHNNYCVKVKVFVLLLTTIRLNLTASSTIAPLAYYIFCRCSKVILSLDPSKANLCLAEILESMDK